MRITITFGAPAGARLGMFQCGVDSARVLPTRPLNVGQLSEPAGSLGIVAILFFVLALVMN